MNNRKNKTEKRERRHSRIRAKISGTQEVPRLNVFKSNTSIYAQIIDDTKGVTLASVSSAKITGKTGLERAEKAGEELAKSALKKKIEKVVFDRGGNIYTGQIKGFADGARKAGLKF